MDGIGWLFVGVCGRWIVMVLDVFMVYVKAEWRGGQTLRDCLPTSSQPTCPSQHLSDRAASVGESKNGVSSSRYGVVPRT